MLVATSRWSIRRPVLVVVLWLAAVVASFTVGVGVFDRLVSDVGVVPGSESDRAYTLIGQAGPEPIELTAIVHGHRADDPAVRSAVDVTVTDLRAIPGVVAVADPVPSMATGNAVLIRLRLAPGAGAEAVAQAAAQRLYRITAGTVTVAGGPLTEDEFNAQAQSDVQRAELLTTPVVLLLLLVVFGGLVAAGLPLLIAVAGVGGTFGLLYGFSLVVDVSVYAIQVATMLSVGLAVDYGLLMVSRFREERADHPDVPAAVGRTVATAGRTVAYSGLTVAAVLAGLLVFPEPFLRSMGLAGVGVVTVVVLAALTLLPALLTLLGHRIKPATPPAPGGGVFARVARGVQRRPLLTMLAATGAMTIPTLPVLDLRLAPVDARLLPEATQTRQLHDAIAVHFPELARPHPIVIVVDAPADSPEVADLSSRIATVAHVSDVEATPAGSMTVLRATLDQPAHSRAARHAVETVRTLDAPVEVAVTGDTALLIDYQNTITDHLPSAVAIIAVGTLILLFLFTGSILLPIKAVLTNLLSVGAALGAVVWVFQQGHLANWFGTERLSATHVSVPVLVATIAFGLSVDYEVFLLSRIRERWLATGDNDHAVADGLQHTGRIITSAALLLGVVFAGFLTAGFVPVQAIGLGLLLAVALDATIVRLLLVPATMTLAGRYNWWAPQPLRRVHSRLGVHEPPAPHHHATTRRGRRPVRQRHRIGDAMRFRRSCPLPGTRRPPWHHRVRTAIGAPIGRYLSGQAAHPHGRVGRLIAWNWVRETAAVNDTAIEVLAARPGERICEIGFGPGRTLAHLAATGTHVIGVDISPDMVTVAGRRNAAAVAAGQIRLFEGDGTALPVGDDALDGALSVHSVYFWPDPAAVLAEIRRVLRPGGRLVLALRPGEHPLPARFDPTIYRVPTTTELTGWLHAAGFTDIRTEHRPRPATVVWLTAV